MPHQVWENYPAISEASVFKNGFKEPKKIKQFDMSNKSKLTHCCLSGRASQTN